MSGGRIWLDAEIRLGYVMRPTLGRLAVQYWRYGKGRAQTVRKHRMQPRLRQMIPPAVLLATGLALLLAPFLPAALLVPAGYLALLTVATGHSLLARRSACALWVAPALLVMHMAWGAGFLRQMLGRRP